MQFISIPKNVIDRTGHRYGRLLVLGAVPIPQHLNVSCSFVWKCKCDCGANALVLTGRLVSGGSKSCGCLRREASWEHVGNHKHGGSSRPEYSVWKGMIRRCVNPKAANYQRYGGRGIKVCEEWKQFKQFFADMGKRPSCKHTLERIDNNGNYDASNCKWVTRREQSFNTRRTLYVTAFGRTASLSEYFDSSNSIAYDRAHHRISIGWDAEAAIQEPAFARKK